VRNGLIRRIDKAISLIKQFALSEGIKLTAQSLTKFVNPQLSLFAKRPSQFSGKEDLQGWTNFMVGAPHLPPRENSRHEDLSAAARASPAANRSEAAMRAAAAGHCPGAQGGARYALRQGQEDANLCPVDLAV
jgi:hypothetical protein